MIRLIATVFTVISLALGIAQAKVGVGTDVVNKMVREHHVKEVDFQYVRDRIGDGRIGHTKAVIFDARPAKRYDAGHIPGAILLPDTQIKQNMEMLSKIPKNKEIITYCQGPSCEKSVILAVELAKIGYSNVKVYRGGIPEWEKKDYVDIGVNTANKMYADNKALFIDARPFAKFKKASVIGALNLPDTQFDKLWGRLPTDPKTPVVIFCGGLACEKSHIVAQKMVGMGYKNVFTMSEGFPAWVKAGYETTSSSGSTKAKSDRPKQVGPIVLGADEGMVDFAFFQTMIKNKPDNIAIIDVRDPTDYKLGHIKGALNIPKKDVPLEKFKAQLPKDKYMIFTCSTGTKALETWVDLKSSSYKNLDKAYYLDATVACQGENCTFEENELL